MSHSEWWALGSMEVWGWVSAAAAPSGSAQLSRLPSRTTSPAWYWPEPGRQQYGLMEVEFVSGTAGRGLGGPSFRVQNISRVSGAGAPGWGAGRP